MIFGAHPSLSPGPQGMLSISYLCLACSLQLRLLSANGHRRNVYTRARAENIHSSFNVAILSTRISRKAAWIGRSVSPNGKSAHRTSVVTPVCLLRTYSTAAQQILARGGELSNESETPRPRAPNAKTRETVIRQAAILTAQRHL